MTAAKKRCPGLRWQGSRGAGVPGCANGSTLPNGPRTAARHSAPAPNGLTAPAGMAALRLILLACLGDAPPVTELIKLGVRGGAQLCRAEADQGVLPGDNS